MSNGATSGNDTLTGGEGKDTLVGLGGDDELYGRVGSDSLDGGSGRDLLEGEEGNDTLEGGIGNDTLRGGEGEDSLEGGDGDDLLQDLSGDGVLKGGDGRDTLDAGTAFHTDVGSLTLDGGDGDDRIIANGAAVVVIGGAGHDTVVAHWGLSSISLGSGSDVAELTMSQTTITGLVDGGSGFDTARLDIDNDGTIYNTMSLTQVRNFEQFLVQGEASLAVVELSDVNISSSGKLIVAGDPEGDDCGLEVDGSSVTAGRLDLRGSGNVDILRGGSQDDTIAGSGGNDSLFGNDGADALDGGSGKDKLDGGGDADTLDGGTSNDTLTGGLGDDLLDGGEGVDTVVFSGNRADYTITEDLTLGGIIVEGPDGTDVLRNVNVLKFADQTFEIEIPGVSLTGDEGQSDTLTGGEGKDTLVGLGGDDELYGRVGSDSLDGGSGRDLLEGEEGNDTLEGGIGNDTLRGGEGEDSLEGGDGDDLLQDLSGDGVLKGGDGRDTLDAGTAFHTDVGSLTLDGGDGDDRIIANGAAVVVIGGAGHDTVVAHWGLSSISLGSGSDVAELTMSQTTITGLVDGGSGFDTARLDIDNDGTIYNTMSLTQVRNFEQFLVQGEASLAVVELSDVNISSSGKLIVAGDPEGDDCGLEVDGSSVTAGRLDLRGSGNVDILRGGSQDDTIAGSGGNDSLFGNDGADALDGGSGKDKLDGGGDADTLDGGTSNDTLTGGLGDDLLDGGEGVDTVVFSGNRADYTITEDLTLGGIIVEGPDGTDVLRNVNVLKFADQTFEIEIPGVSLTGDEGQSDTLTGGEGKDTLVGLGGDDELYGRVGSDSLDGGSGRDLLEGEEGNDTLEGGIGNDTLRGGEGEDSLEGGDGDDLLQDLSGDGVLKGGDGRDTLDAGTAFHTDVGSLTLDGGDGDDRIIANGAAVVVIGGAGHDTVVAHWGLSSISLGSGSDVAELTMSQTTITGLVDGGSGFDTARLDIDNDGTIYNTMSLTQVRNFEQFLVQGEASLAVVELSDVNISSSGKLIVAGDPEGDDCGLEVDGSSVTAGRLDLRGSGNVDILRGGSQDDTIAGSGGNDSLFGNDGADALDGGSGKDKLDGGGDADTLDGGTSNDTLTGGLGDDLLDGGEGVDTVVFSGNRADYTITEDLTLGGIIVEGPDGTDVLRNVNVLKFADQTFEIEIPGMVVVGTDRDDSYEGTEVSDDIAGAGGDDTIDGGAGGDDLSGGDGRDSLVGGSGADVLDGGHGGDRMSGGTGDDIYIVDRANDVVTENSGSGDDLVRASVSYQLARNIERLHLTGSANLDATGNGLNNSIKGNSGENLLRGGKGVDRLYAGDDNKEDRFIFAKLDSGATESLADKIYQFDRGTAGEAVHDMIDLRLIDADARSGDQALRYVSSFKTAGARESDGQVRVISSDGLSRVEIDLDGDNKADQLILVDVAGSGHLTKVDFIL